jgi:Glycosyltransferase Family 4
MRVLLMRKDPSARARVHSVALGHSRPDIQLALARQGGPGGEAIEQQWALDDHPARGLREVLAEFAPDLIHSHGSAALTVTAIELTAGRIPVLHDHDGTGSDATHNGHGADVERRAIEECSALIVSSQETLDRLLTRFALPPERCVFPSYPLSHELPYDQREHSGEANIGRIATLYERLSREPLVGLRGSG